MTRTLVSQVWHQYHPVELAVDILSIAVSIWLTVNLVSGNIFHGNIVYMFILLFSAGGYFLIPFVKVFAPNECKSHLLSSVVNFIGTSVLILLFIGLPHGMGWEISDGYFWMIYLWTIPASFLFAWCYIRSKA